MVIARFIKLTEKKVWKATLHRCGRFDTYHLPEYHSVVKDKNQQAYLFHINWDAHNVALPLLVADDKATSVYGYPGPVISSIDGEHEGLRYWFQFHLRAMLNNLGIQFLETRFNPLINSTWLLKGMAEINRVGTTVAIDLKQPLKFSKGHKYDIKKAGAAGVIVYQDTDWRHLYTFIRDYYETMERNGAGRRYFFSEAYFYDLRKALGAHIELWVAELEHEIVSSALFFFSSDIIQYHLSATPNACRAANGGKVILADVAKRAQEQNCWRFLHLGGGLGGDEDDPLFTFKKGFSKLRLPFCIARWEA